ncbi:MAG: SpoIIE family protein phosphatase [Ignavibacteriales bacterium]|nr:MAG: SpoIIE family protein phosphatase [Ignavibacteriales bacterium]
MKILIADDLQETLLLLKATLVRWGHDVVTADNGADAFRIVRDQEISMVLSDWRMPELDGIELCRKIRTELNERYIYFILLTSSDDRNELVRGLDEGADDFITKPIDFNELRARIRAGERIVELETSLASKNAMLEESNRQMERELTMAADLQKSLLPPPLLRLNGYDFSGMFIPSTYVAGDLFDFFRIDDDYAAFYLFDVSGHGASAAMLSFSVKKTLSLNQIEGRDLFLRKDPATGVYSLNTPSSILENLNRLFSADNESLQYFTIVLGILNLREDTITISSAGHPPVLYIRNDGSIEPLPLNGFPAGMFGDSTYQNKMIDMKSGDSLLLYSDGLTDLVFTDNSGLPVGFEEVASRLDISTAEKFTGALSSRISMLSSEQKLADDISAVILKKT